MDPRVHVTVSFFEEGLFNRGFVGVLVHDDGHGAESEPLGTDVDFVDGGIDVVFSVPTHAEKTGATERIDGHMLVGLAGYAARVGERGELEPEILVSVLEVKGGGENDHGVESRKTVLNGGGTFLGSALGCGFVVEWNDKVRSIRFGGITQKVSQNRHPGFFFGIKNRSSL